MFDEEGSVPRYKLIVEYDGGPYVGWQWQANGLSVQQVLEEALEKFAGHAVRLHCAGRTDAGVHATHQVVHADLTRKEWRADVVRDAANAYLRGTAIGVVAAERVEDGFHARFSACRRHYLYRIVNRRVPPVLEAARVWHVPGPLDAGLMQAAAQALIGEHDFTTFRATDCQAKSPIKTLEVFDVSRADDAVSIRASSRSFLHHQVRSMVGTIALAGSGRWSIADIRRALEARQRTACGPMAPAKGLYLIGVDYAE